jgi:molybdopterin molybdotransferase
MISFAEARALILDAATPLGAEPLDLAQAWGRALAEDAAAREDIPLRDDSAMDGFAVRAADAAGALADHPVRLKIAGEAPAGRPWDGTLPAGEAIRVFTGGLIPGGADAVVPVEKTRSDGDGALILEAPKPGAFIRRAGGDMARGAVVLKKGHLLDAGALGVLAALGIARPKVARAPRVALLMSGDELVDPGEPLQPGQVRDVSSFTLAALASEAGALTVLKLRVRDDLDALRQAMERAFAEADVVLSAGGVSMGGERDLLRPAFREAGGEEIFWRVAQKPGKPLAFGRLGEKLWFGLPGNPVSVWTCFHAYVAPALRRMTGLPDDPLSPLRVVARDRVPTPAPLTHFLRCRLEAPSGQWVARMDERQGSSLVSTLADHDALLIVPPDASETTPGESFDALPVRLERIAALWAETLRGGPRKL